MNDRKTKADVASRRHLLKLGAMAAPAVITLAPASARAAASVLNCRVPFPENVDDKGDPCSKPSKKSGLGYGNASETGNSNAADFAVQGGGGGGGGRGGSGGGGGGRKDDPNICYEGPGPQLNAEEINNLQSVAAAHSSGNDAYERYQAYSKYLKKVREKNLPGASCLMSIDMTAR